MSLDIGEKVSRSNAETMKMDEPQFLRELLPEQMLTLDVRTFFDEQKEPLPAILEAAGRLESDQVLRLLVPFEPIPLFGVLGAQGFSHWSLPPETTEGFWTIYFYREKETVESTVDHSNSEASSDDLLEIDLRGVAIEEVLTRVPEALDQLVYGNVLLMRYHREPVLLFMMLGERGFGHRGKPVDSGEWEIRIWRKD